MSCDGRREGGLWGWGQSRKGVCENTIIRYRSSCNLCTCVSVWEERGHAYSFPAQIHTSFLQRWNKVLHLWSSLALRTTVFVSSLKIHVFFFVSNHSESIAHEIENWYYLEACVSNFSAQMWFDGFLNGQIGEGQREQTGPTCFGFVLNLLFWLLEILLEVLYRAALTQLYPSISYFL